MLISSALTEKSFEMVCGLPEALLVVQRDDAADRARGIGDDVKVHAALGAGGQVAEVLVAARTQIRCRSGGLPDC